MGFLDFIFGKHEENVKDKEASNDMPVNPAPEKNKSNMISNESNSGKTLPVEVEISKKKISPFRITLSFTPLRLSAYKKNPVTLIVKITNNLDKEQLVSVDALLPSNSMLGFDGIGVNKINETKVGKIMPGEKKEARIEIWANNQTKKGKYPIEVRVYSHYLNYNKVLSYVRKSTNLRVA